MSSRRRSSATIRDEANAPTFAALGDRTRLALVAKLCTGQSHSIAELTDGTKLTRQAVTKHLLVLEHAGIVRSARRGRETLFAFEPAPIARARHYLERVAEQWDDVLARLKSPAED